MLGGGRCGVHVVKFPGQASQPGSLASLLPPWDSYLLGPPLRGNNETPVSPMNRFSFSSTVPAVKVSRALLPCSVQGNTGPVSPLLSERSPSQSYLKLCALTGLESVCFLPLPWLRLLEPCPGHSC